MTDSMETLGTAKQLFMKYGGSFFHMDREGEYEHYKSLGISREQEKVWIEEYQRDLLKSIESENDGVKIRTSVRALVSSICDHGDGANNYGSTMVEVIKRKASTVDSFSKLLICESILRLVEFSPSKGGATIDIAFVKATVAGVLQGVITNPTDISMEDRDNILYSEVIQSKSIVSRAQMCLAKMSD